MDISGGCTSFALLPVGWAKMRPDLCWGLPCMGSWPSLPFASPFPAMLARQQGRGRTSHPDPEWRQPHGPINTDVYWNHHECPCWKVTNNEKSRPVDKACTNATDCWNHHECFSILWMQVTNHDENGWKTCTNDRLYTVFYLGGWWTKSAGLICIACMHLHDNTGSSVLKDCNMQRFLYAYATHSKLYHPMNSQKQRFPASASSSWAGNCQFTIMIMNIIIIINLIIIVIIIVIVIIIISIDIIIVC